MYPVLDSGFWFEFDKYVCSSFRADVTYGVILLYYIIIIYYYIIIHILYYTLPSSVRPLLFPNLSSSSLLSFSYIIPSLSLPFSSIPLLFLFLLPILFPNLSSYSFLLQLLLWSILLLPLPIILPLLIQSIRVGIWIYLLILFQLYRCFDPACFIGVDGWGV